MNGTDSSSLLRFYCSAVLNVENTAAFAPYLLIAHEREYDGNEIVKRKYGSVGSRVTHFWYICALEISHMYSHSYKAPVKPFIWQYETNEYIVHLFPVRAFTHTRTQTESEWKRYNNLCRYLLQSLMSNLEQVGSDWLVSPYLNYYILESLNWVDEWDLIWEHNAKSHVKLICTLLSHTQQLYTDIALQAWE